MAEPTLSYCGTLVRHHDPDRFLMSLMMPPEAREALWALFAFNYEIARTREVVSETTLGLIRLQWWKDALRAVYAGEEAPPNEIMPALTAAIRAHGLPCEDFERLLTAREFDLADAVPETMDGLLLYARETQEPLVRLALRILGQEEADPAMVRDVALAYTLAGLLRAAPFHAGRRRCYMPSDVLAAHGVDLESLYAGRPGNGLRGAAQEVAGRAEALLAGVRPQGRFLKGMAAVSALYIKQIKGINGDIYRLDPQRLPAFFHLRFLFRLMF